MLWRHRLLSAHMHFWVYCTAIFVKLSCLEVVDRRGWHERQGQAFSREQPVVWFEVVSSLFHDWMVIDSGLACSLAVDEAVIMHVLVEMDASQPDKIPRSATA